MEMMVNSICSGRGQPGGIVERRMEREQEAFAKKILN